MTIAQVAELVERVGIPTAVAILVIWVMILVIQAGMSLFSRSEEAADENQKERAELRAQNAKLINERLELERKFTECREQLVDMRNKNELIETQKDNAVERFLDETQDYERELRLKERELASIAQQLKETSEQLRLCSEKVASLSE